MFTATARLAIGFAAGALSHLVFQGGLGALYHAFDLIPALPWSLDPVPPLGVPKTASSAFWAGLWGMLFGALLPWLRARWGLGLLGSGLAVGVAAQLCRWLIVLPLKGQPIAEGFVVQPMLIFTGFHIVFGIGLALIYEAIRRLLAGPAIAASGRA